MSVSLIRVVHPVYNGAYYQICPWRRQTGQPIFINYYLLPPRSSLWRFNVNHSQFDTSVMSTTLTHEFLIWKTGCLNYPRKEWDSTWCTVQRFRSADMAEQTIPIQSRTQDKSQSSSKISKYKKLQTRKYSRFLKVHFPSLCLHVYDRPARVVRLKNDAQALRRII